MKGTHSERNKEVRKGPGAEVLGFVEDFGDPTRAELPAALPASSQRLQPIADPLGEPLGVREVARVIGCSPWTVRQKYVPAGLPHLRSGPNGKLIFYKTQVIRWLLERQQKGGIRK
jgi:hypothetical protein